MSGGKGAHLITEKEWEAGNELLRTENGLFPRPEDSAVVYQGPPMPRSGPKWEGTGGNGGPLRTLFTATSNRAAVNSWDGVDITYSFLDPTSLFQRNKVQGSYWIDIYETATAKPLVRIQGSFSGAEPYEFQEHRAGWYSDRYYVLPVGHAADTYHFNLRRLLICDVDAASVKAAPC